MPKRDGKSPVREEVHRALIMTRRLGGGVPLVAAADREEVIDHDSNIMLHCTIFKAFVSIVPENRLFAEQGLGKPAMPPIDSSVPVCLIGPGRMP